MHINVCNCINELCTINYILEQASAETSLKPPQLQGNKGSKLMYDLYIYIIAICFSIKKVFVRNIKGHHLHIYNLLLI